MPTQTLLAISLRQRLGAHLRIARLDHSIKQLFVVPGIVLAVSLGCVFFSGPTLVWKIIVGFLATTLIACSNYVINEMLDAPFDRTHPVKKSRPAASGF